ncbi:MAG: triple tyrosine motif-containing protein, partial [Verrucomicrobiota bacterium]
MADAPGISAFAPDQEGRIWCLTSPGLGVLGPDGWFAFPEEVVSLPKSKALICDASDGLWCTVPLSGVVWLNRKDLLRFARGETRSVAQRRFGYEHGVGSLVFSYTRPVMARRSDGRIVVATEKGLSVVDPADWLERRGQAVVPEPFIRQVLVDDAVRFKEGFSEEGERRRMEPQVVPSSGHRVEFGFSALHLPGSEHVSYRYRLDGIDPDWVEARGRRSAHYHQLPPGDYTFRVAAGNRYGRWNSSEAAAAIRVLPAWWETAGFKLGAGAGCVGFIGFMILLRINVLRNEQKIRDEFSKKMLTG